MHLLSNVLLVAAAFGLLVLAVEHLSLWRHLRESVPAPTEFPGISILKPLCGIDDDLEANLEVFATLDYPHYELLLGVKSEEDPAYPLACEAARRWPDRVRVVVQRGTPGLNAKVNQLLTLEQEARHDVLLVSDSNVRVGPDYLKEVAYHLADPKVALVTHGIVGFGEDRLGSWMDRLHLASFVTPGLIAPGRILGVGLVVGKSMAMRKATVADLGGFAAYKDVLAEDYLIGRAVQGKLRRQIRFAHTMVANVSYQVTVGEFYRRYVRWDIIQRKLIGRFFYAFQILLNPPAIALLAWLCEPTARRFWTFGLVCAIKSLVDGLSRSRLEGSRLRLRDCLLTPVKDLVVGGAFLHALVSNTVTWRGNRLRVMRGTKLAPRAETD